MQQDREQLGHIQDATAADPHDKLRLAGADEALNLRHIVLARLGGHRIHDLHLTPLILQKRADLLRGIEFAHVAVSDQQNAPFARQQRQQSGKGARAANQSAVNGCHFFLLFYE